MSVNIEVGRVIAVGDRVRPGSMYPLYTTVALSSGERVECISKFPCLENRAPAEFVLNEWFGTTVAWLAGAQVPACCLSSVSDDIQSYIRDKHGLNLISQLGFSSVEWPIEGVLFPESFQKMAEEDLALIYCLDLLFLNSDRTPGNPNCGQELGRPFAYDFGSSFLSPKNTIKAADTFFFGTKLNDRASAHLFRSLIRSPEIVDSVIRGVIAATCERPWYESLDISLIPESMRDHAGLMIQYLQFVAREKDMLTRQIVSTI